jgi:hypothetical protein
MRRPALSIWTRFDMIKIGEKMSIVTDINQAFWAGNDVYETQEHWLIGRPFDTGRLLYAKLYDALPIGYQIEVTWDHFSNVLTVEVAGRDIGLEVSFYDEPMSRVQKLERVDEVVAYVKEGVSPSSPS